LVRAVQTSTVLATALGFAGPFRAHRSLYPDGPISGIEALLEHHPGRTVIVVGHQPLIGAAAAFLLGRTELPKAVSPGTVIGVERANAQATPSTSRLICFAQVGQPVLETLSNGV
jgi:phosphohistidine phosphatase